MEEFQLVLQFRPWGNRSPKVLHAVEERLEAEDALDEDVDGHDFGSGEANIFLFTADPLRTITRCIPAVAAEGLLDLLGAGYRRVNEDQYVRVWPLGDTAPFDVL